MPVAPPVSYPGVYIQEVPSSVHTIAPVATSDTAFIGRALRGPVNDPQEIHSMADFERIFGGLWEQSELGYAVSDFFMNGGSTAIIVRIYEPDAGSPPPSGKAVLELPITASPQAVLEMEAKSEGAWGNSLKARVDYIYKPTSPPADTSVVDAIVKQFPPQYSIGRTDIFSLTVYDEGTKTTEVFANVTVKNSPRRVDKVLEQGSQLVSCSQDLDSSPLTTIPDQTAQPGNDTTGLPLTAWADSNAHVKAQHGSDGQSLKAETVKGDAAQKTGIYALEHVDIFNILCIPTFDSTAYGHGDSLYSEVLPAAAAYCEKRRAVFLVDPPSDWTSKDTVKSNFPLTAIANNTNGAVYFPRILKADENLNGQIRDFAPCGAIAGVIARTDQQRGVWKAPAGLEATFTGVMGLKTKLTDPENGELNPKGINCLRSKGPAGNVIWGARTLAGDDLLASQWKYLPVRRTALFIEESLYRGTQWAVFEPNDEPLWAQLRLNIGVFMHDLFRQGAFQGQSPKDAYFVKCDSTTTTQSDIDRGIVNVIVGFAPLKPAEFVVLYIQQIAGNLAT